MPDPRINELVKYWTDQYLAMKGKKYMWQKKDFGSMKKLFNYFDETYSSESLNKLKVAAIRYLMNDTYFSKVRGWPFCDFSNNPVPWADPLPVPGLEEWEALQRYVQREGRYGNKPLPLSEKGLTCLRKIGGFNNLCNSSAWTAEHVLKKEFLALYFGLDKTDVVGNF